MSILQEYEEIKKHIGMKEWNNIEEFLECNPHYLLSDVLYNEETIKHYLKWKLERFN